MRSIYLDCSSNPTMLGRWPCLMMYSTMMVQLNKNNSHEGWGVDVEHKMCWKNNRSCLMKRRRMWPPKRCFACQVHAMPSRFSNRTGRCRDAEPRVSSQAINEFVVSFPWYSRLINLINFLHVGKEESASLFAYYPSYPIQRLCDGRESERPQSTASNRPRPISRAFAL